MNIKDLKYNAIYEYDCGFTAINCDFATAKKYYEGNFFNCGRVSDKIKKCIKIELLGGEK